MCKLALFALAIFWLVFPAMAPAGEIKLEKVKASELEKAIVQHKGKVVVVDVWADFCTPCKKKFPHLVRLHKEFSDQGLVCISVSVDLEDNFDGALDFLKKQNATFNNYILWDTEENKDELEKILPHTAIPIFHVFDKDGKRARTWEGSINDDEIDKLVQQLLKK